MKKKVLALLLIVAVIASLCLGLVACNKNKSETYNTQELSALEGMWNPDYSSFKAKAGFKAGLICLHDQTSTYDKNFIDAFVSACDSLGVEYIIKTGIDESAACLTAAEDLIDQGCDYIFADSFGHESWIMQAATKYPNVQFCHATGTHAHTAKIANFHNAFASIYEGRYLAGVAAGMKLNEMIAAGKITAAQAKMGYVGAHPYAEVISGYTSFYLGAKSVCPTVTMEVKYTNSWYDEAAERETANYLIMNGAVLISQHADSMGAPSACELAGVPNVSYNGSTITSCKSTFIVSSKINWEPYFKYSIAATNDEKAFDADWTGTMKTGSVQLTAINMDVAAEGTIAKLEEVRNALVAGTIQVFDCSTFKIGGKTITEYIADVIDEGDYVAETDVVKTAKGITYIAESTDRSAPYFASIIDGITVSK